MRIRYFAWLRQRTGCAEEEIALPEGVATVGQLLEHLGRKHPRLGELVAAESVIKCAVNHDYADPDRPLAPEDEVAFFPPVTGG